jgi:hypothetical protein
MEYDDYDNNDKRLSVQLASTEAAVLAAASRLYAAYITSGQASATNEKEFMKKSIKQALLMATTIDDSVKAEGEF